MYQTSCQSIHQLTPSTKYKPIFRSTTSKKTIENMDFYNKRIEFLRIFEEKSHLSNKKLLIFSKIEVNNFISSYFHKSACF